MTTTQDNQQQRRDITSAITAHDLPFILSQYPNIKVLSLDCFDTLIWRQTAEPKDIFQAMEKSPVCQQLKFTAYQRIQAAQRAYREAFIQEGHHQISLKKIYARFTSLSEQEQELLIQEEIKTECSLSFAFPPMVELIKQAHALGLKIIIVSDTYLNPAELATLLKSSLTDDIMSAISGIYCSSTYKISKSDGLFETIKKELNMPGTSILHLGDHEIADVKAPQLSGLNSAHFIQYTPQITNYLHTLHTISPLTALSNPYAGKQRAIRFSPFRPVFSITQPSPLRVETSIGYMTFGPILYAFAKFVSDEIAQLKASGKHPKVFFLLRDAFLLSKATEAYCGQPVGKLVRLRKFVSVAASFKKLADIDHYLSSIKPQHFNMAVIGEQLLLPWNITQQLIQLAQQDKQPDRRFYELIRQPEITKFIFEKSSDYRRRLKRYIDKEMNIQPGDTVVLVDTGYIGVTQEFFSRTFKETLDIDVLGLYFMGSHEPDRPNCKALLDSDWCEHGLFEQSCTYKEGAVLDYSEEGDPIFDQIKLSDLQYQKVTQLQDEAIRFIKDAKAFFETTKEPDFTILQEHARASLKKQIFFPTEAETTYFSSYQHDKDMGTDGKKTMFNLPAINSIYKYQHQPNLHPYEARAIHLSASLDWIMKKGFELNFKNEPTNFRTKEIDIIITRLGLSSSFKIKSTATSDGYHHLTTPLNKTDHISILFGKHYQWIQLDAINLTTTHVVNGINVHQYIRLDKMINVSSNLFECQLDGKLDLLPLADHHEHRFNIIFRPLVERG